MNKKMIISAFCAVLLATSLFAADTSVATNKPVVNVNPVTVAYEQNNPSLFNSGEVGVSLSTGYTVNRAAAFQQPYTVNVGAGAFWFPLRNVGVEVNVPIYQSKGVSVNEVQAGLLFRLPLAKETPVFKSLAPYVGVGGVYNWKESENWAYIAKVGLEFRFNKKWGVFCEGQYRNIDFDWNKGQTSVVGGLKLSF